MPEINLVPVTKYDPLFPYHHEFDNLPIDGLATRIFLVNAQTDINANILRESIGTQGTLSNRLNQSLDPDGSLKTEAVDEALHSIESHSDTASYVRMLQSERNKLSLIDDNATNLGVEVETISNTLEWPSVDVVMSVGPSPTITWRMCGDQLVADTVVPISAQHVHVYDVTPITSDSINFKTTTVNTAYKAGTLRVYVNGLRLTADSDPIGGFYFTEDDPDSGTFSLNTALQTGDIIRIDFDQPIS